VKAASFNHFPRAADQGRCLLAYTYHPIYSWLENVELEVIEARAAALRNKFFQLDNLKRAITSSVFALLLSKADDRGIWRCAGMPVWAVPYILLSYMVFLELTADIKWVSDKLNSLLAPAFRTSSPAQPERIGVVPAPAHHRESARPPLSAWQRAARIVRRLLRM